MKTQNKKLVNELVKDLSKSGKKDKQFTTETWLPVFNGYYSTLLGDKFELDYELEGINQDREDNNKAPLKYDDLNLDYAAAELKLSKCVYEAVISQLFELNLISEAKFDGVWSPKEYNFTNDSINASFSFNDKNVKTIISYLKTNAKEWSAYLVEHFKSRSGFISFHSHIATDDHWTPIHNALSNSARCGAVLDFILLNEGFDSERLYYSREVENFYIGEFVEIIEPVLEDQPDPIDPDQLSLEL